MNAQQIVIGIYKLLRANGCKNLVERTRSAARAAGAEFRNESASSWIAAYLKTDTSRGRERDDVKTAQGRAFEHGGDASGTAVGRKRDSRVVKESLVSISLLSSLEESTPVVSKPEKPVRQRKPVPVADWVEPLKTSVWQLGSLRLDELTVEQRVIVARYHVLKFTNCSRVEAVNRSRAITLMGALSDIGSSPKFGVFTVRDYFEALAVVAEHAQSKRIWSPWAFKGALEHVAATA